MITAVCIDDENGMTFNHRRQSRDRVLIENLVALCGDRKIFMNEYSSVLFSDYAEQIVVDEDFMEKAGADDICFVENVDLTPYADRIQGVILYRWNRLYPSSTTFDVDLSGFTLTDTVEFAGSSHDNITREEYAK